VAPWRRGEPLHERLAREGGIALPGTGSPRRPLWDQVGIHGLHRQREWDAVVALEADADEAERQFVVLEDTVIVESDGSLPEAFASAFDDQLPPPYRVVAIPQGGRVWALGARRIEVAELPGLAGDEVELAVSDDGWTMLVDGERTLGSVPALEALAQHRGLVHYVVHAERLDDDVWEVRVAAL
jgi:hypothetical protein